MTLSFDALASQFDDQRGLPAHALRQLVEFVGGVSRSEPLGILEPGIGTGRIALPLAAAGHAVTGIDVSRRMLDACAAKAGALRVSSRVRLVEGDATDLPVHDDSFDVGMFASLLYLVPHWEAVLDELARVVRPGGAVIHLIERTEPGYDLARWDAAWRERIESTGFSHQALSPTDDEVYSAMGRRWPDLTTDVLASWTFGQTVNTATDGYSQRLRALYPDVPDAAWDSATSDFLAWAATAFPDPQTILGGQVALTAVTAWL